MADGKPTAEAVAVPLEVKTSDLPVRALSAVVLLALAGVALYLGGWWLDGLIALFALIALFEAMRLILMATPNASFRLAALIVALAYIGLAAAALLAMPGVAMVVVVVTVIVTDIGAYFTGRAIGGPRIAPSISPSKTWAGLIGGMVAAALWLALVAWVIGAAVGALATSPEAQLTGTKVALAAAAGAGLALAAQAGDFLESWLKRKAGVKDSSRLIPGHGGVLDRVDGMLPVAIIAGLAGGWTGW